MITLYESNITSMPLDNGIGVLSDAITAPAEEELNGMFEYTMEYPSDGYLVEEIKEERIIKAKAQDKLGYQLFRIYSITKNHDNDNITINAQHITYDLGNNFIEALNASGLTKQQVMQLIGASTVEQHTFNITSPNNSTRSSTKLYRTNPLQMIAGMEGSVLQIWGGQIERDNFNLILHDRRGHDDGVTITYEKNITGLEAVFDINGLITRIFPFVLIEATDDSPERLITVNGNYIDSEHINDYEQVFIEPIDYTHNDRMDLQDKTDAEIRTQLTNLANSYFEETDNDKPKVTLNVNFAHLWETEEYKNVAPLELVGMGDTVTVNHSRLGIEATAIVNRIVYDSIADINLEVGIGNVKARLSDTVNKIDRIEQKVEEAQSNANHAITAANGKNTIYYGPDEPTSGMILNDTWFEQVDNQFVRTWRFDGIQWQVMIDMDSYEAKQEAMEAKDRANEAYDNAGLANDNAMTAIGNAQSAFDKAQESLTGLTTLAGFVDDNTGEITTIKGSVEGLQATVQGKVDNDTFTTFVQQTNSSLAGKISMTDAEGVFVKGTIFSATIDGLQTTVQNKADKSTVTQLAGVVDTKISTVDANNKFATQSQLTQTASSLTSTITSVRNDLDGLEIGGRNYQIDTSNQYKTVTWTHWNEYPRQANNDYYHITVEPNTTYTASVYYRNVNTSDGVNVGVRIFWGLEGGGRLESPNGQVSVANGSEGRAVATFTSPPNAINALLVFRKFSSGGSATAEYKEAMFEKGNVATDWTPAPEDMATQSQISQLSNAINLRVTKDDLINQINIDTTGILISGKKLILDGDTTVNGTFKLDGSAHILDATIGTAQIAEISANKLVSGEINTNNITIRGGNATEYTNIQGSTLELRGIYERTWRGTSTNHDVRTRLHRGHLRFRNDILERSLYISEFGISTYLDGEGEDGGSSGSIVWWDKTYSPSGANGLTLESHGGVVALRTNSNRIVLDSNASINLDADDAPIYIRPRKAHHTSYNQTYTFTTADSSQDAFMMYGHEDNPDVGFRLYYGSSTRIAVVDGNYSRGGNTKFDVGMLETNEVKSRNNSHIELTTHGSDPSSSVNWRLTKSEDRKDGYLLYGQGEDKVGFRIKGTRNGTIEIVNTDRSTGVNTSIEAGLGYFNDIKRRVGNNNIYIAHANLLTVGDDSAGGRLASIATYNRTYNASANMHITNAGTFGRSTSARKYKTAIEPITAEYAYNFYNNAHPVYYKPKNTHDENMEYSHYGYIADDVALIEPRLVQFGENGEPESFNYDRVPTLLHVVMKEEVKRIDKLESIVRIQQKTIDNLQLKISKMESAA